LLGQVRDLIRDVSNGSLPWLTGAAATLLGIVHFMPVAVALGQREESQTESINASISIMPIMLETQQGMTRAALRAGSTAVQRRRVIGARQVSLSDNINHALSNDRPIPA
jgi:hypothetical protein